ncbi:hypothetical protein IKF28_02125 [Candidatus Saccharibacteria bacterium]|nr:hypothetical protein [Candidatus Saccharibacteria bacterium]
MTDDAEEKVKKGIESNKRWIAFWIVALSVIIVFVGWAAIGQHRSDTNEGPKTTQVKSLTCKSDDSLYPFFTFDDSDRRELKTIVTFIGDDVGSISLQQMLYYTDAGLIPKSESENHAAMNNSFSRDGMAVDALDATYAVLSNGLKFSIYSKFDKLNDNEMKYFLLDNLDEYDYNKIKEAYTDLGLNCGNN